MISIAKAKPEDNQLLARIGRETFLQSHGHSGPEKDILQYVDRNFTPAVFEKELHDPGNLYHIIYHHNHPAGYSKLTVDAAHPNIPIEYTSKLERIYLLREFHSRGMGHRLFQWNLGLSREHGQHGIWLFVWKENTRAVEFYIREGFRIVGSYDFRISDTHANPNHQMLLLY